MERGFAWSRWLRVDSYGDTRPIFWNGRVFALMAFEPVEGRERGSRVREAGRISFAPGPQRR